ncbi:MAG: Na+/H+ antiporter subunit D [Acidimicrobiales bacterium mtb01]|nr:Na+/H+ antiporter subunit D [Actinomycetota bacterium]TEX47943.1 MAG: Na+/H+ antiporter subunit D [Acidimicrobiales bacterium mtb01]
MTTVLSLPVLGPLVAAALMIFLRGLAVQRFVSFFALGVSLVASTVTFVNIWDDGVIRVVRMSGWPGSFAITLVADRLSAAMVLVATVVVTIVLAYATGQRAPDERSSFYHPVYMVMAAGISQAFLAGDLFNLFVAFEILLMASYVLLTLEGTNEQIRAGTTYVVLNVLESMILLMAVGLVFAATGTVSMAELPARLAELPDGVRMGLHLLLLVAFGIKAAVFPLFFWLPDSYPTAPSSVSAVFAGLLTKVGVYCLIRTQTLLFPGELSDLVIVIGAATMLVGVLGAISHRDMKRILSFHIVSQIGYMIFGLGIGGVAAIAATIFYLIHHIPVKTSLFLVEGIVARDSGSSSSEEVSGLARRSPILAALFLVPALSLAGLPPFSGFLAKFAIVRAGVSDAQWIGIAVALVVSLLTLVSMVKIWVGVFWGDVSPVEKASIPGVLRHQKTMGVSTGAIVLFSLAIAFAAGPLYEFATKAAEQLLDVAGYVAAVRSS